MQPFIWNSNGDLGLRNDGDDLGKRPAYLLPRCFQQIKGGFVNLCDAQSNHKVPIAAMLFLDGA